MDGALVVFFAQARELAIYFGFDRGCALASALQGYVSERSTPAQSVNFLVKPPTDELILHPIHLKVEGIEDFGLDEGR